MKDHRTSTEMGNRAAKAVRIVALLDQHAGTAVTAPMVAQLPEQAWENVAALTGGRRISLATRDTVAGIVAARKTMTDAEAFSGLGAA